MQKEYKTIKQISGPLVFVEKTEPVGYGELVQIAMPDGTTKRGQVLDTSKDIVVVQVFEGTTGIDRASGVKFLGETIKLSVSKDMLGRILSGAGDPIDGGAPIIPDERREIIGAAITPCSRWQRAGLIIRRSRVQTPLPAPLLPLDGPGRLVGDVVDHAVDVRLEFVGDAARDALLYRPRHR